MALALLPASKTLAQTNAQILYDFGTDRKYVTLSLIHISEPTRPMRLSRMPSSA